MKLQSKIVPHLWYDRQAKEAARLYTSIFPASKLLHEATVGETPSGDTDIATFQLWGQKMMAISAGPHFKFNPSQSLMINFDPSQMTDARTTLEKVWEKLLKNGTALMPLDTYPFSEKYGWLEDEYGLSWQLILTNPDGEFRPPVLPALMFTGENAGLADEAREFYLSVFNHSKTGQVVYYPEDAELNQAGMVMFSDFMLENQWFTTMDSAYAHGFNFNEAISYLIYCDSQAEIDYYWEKLSAVPTSEQCGWLKDQYGVSWQIYAQDIEDMLLKGSPEQVTAVNQAILKMKKLDIGILKKLYHENRK